MAWSVWVVFAATFLVQASWAGIRPIPIGNKEQFPIQPRFEGLYDIEIICPKNPQHCVADRLMRIDRLSVINSRLNTGTWITISSSQHRDYVDRYMEIEVNEAGDFAFATPNGRFGTSGRFSYVEMKFNPVTGHFAGKLVAADSLNDFELRGTPLDTVSQFMNSAPPSIVPASEIVGIYEGALGTLKGTLIIKQLPDEHMIANFDTKEEALGMPILRRPFSSGEWDQEKGILYLTFNLPNLSGQGIMAMAFRSYKNGKIVLQGFETAGAADNRVTFTKVRSLLEK